MNGIQNFFFGDAKFLFKFCGQLASQDLFAGKCHERVQEPDLFFGQLLHIVLDVLGIGGDHGAVVMIAGLRLFIPLIRNAGIKDGPDALGDEPGYMSVYDLGRITFRLAGNGFDAQFVDLSR